MKTPIIFFVSILLFITKILFADTSIPPGDVSGTWTKENSPYLINGEITIPNLSTLTIEPGVLVEFQGHYKLNVQGRLLAIGTEIDTIVLTINDTTGFHNPNIIDGGWAGIRFINVFSMIDSSYIVYCKIEYGKALGFWPDDTGGGICVDGFDKLTISNCLINNNITTGGGGGIALWNSNPEITSNTISNNSAQFGGGIQCYESSPQIENNIIKYNTAESGGGIVCNDYSNPTIINTTIGNNTAGSGGGIVCWNNCGPILDNVTMSNNSATGWAGGGIAASNSELQINHCTFIDNEVINGIGGAILLNCGDTLGITYQSKIINTVITNNTGHAGGGIWANGFDSAMVNVLIDKCEFTFNVAQLYSGLQLLGRRLNFRITNSIFTGNEAIYSGAGAGFIWDCTGTVSNCLFASNNAGTGVNDNTGGVRAQEGANVDFMNCTFADNSASYGAGLTIGGGGTATTTNCIFWGNITDQIALDTLNGQGGTLTVNYCDVQGGEDSVNVIDSLLSTLYWGIGNADGDPLFVNFSNGDYHLHETSPCIQTAIDTIEIAGVMRFCPPDDIEGNPRPYPMGTMPDMGAYEFQFLVGVEENSTVHPTEYALYQNYPNPFNAKTVISYQLPTFSEVQLSIYNILGQKVANLVSDKQPAGIYKMEWDAFGFSSGVYIYKLETDKGFVKSKKLILLK